MALPSPNLDDRHFDQLLEDAKRRIKEKCPEWDDLSVHDPGIVLLEVFAYLTEMMLYRLNRLPEKVYVELLNLLGIKLFPPAAAQVTLRFSVSSAGSAAMVIPSGTRVTFGRSSGSSEPPIFLTEETCRIEPGETQVAIKAFHCDYFKGEKAGVGNGKPQQVVKAMNIPIMARNGSALDLMVGIETDQDDLAAGVRAIQFGGKTYRIWEEVVNFSAGDKDRYVYIVDRMHGTIFFAPALYRKDDSDLPFPQLEQTPTLLARVPELGKEILLWYGSGGGAAGNVPAHVLNLLKDPIPGLKVTNPFPAVGGRDGETLENALRRGPLELHSLERAVTAKDFELVAQSSGSVARAKAITRLEFWKHAQPGTVEVLLVPALPKSQGSQSAEVTVENLKRWQTEETRIQVQSALNERRPLGTTCLVNWVSYKTVRIQAEVVVFKGEDVGAVKYRLKDRLHQMINPLPTPIQITGWPFGQPLRKSQVEYELIRSEPGVSYLKSLQMFVDEVPTSEVSTLVADVHQPHMWYAGAGDRLFRSQNDGESWELIKQVVKEGEEDKISLVRIHPERPGIVAFTRSSVLSEGRIETRLHISLDCGDTWPDKYYQALDFETFDMAWMVRGEVPVLLLATEKGLYELSARTKFSPVHITVKPDEPNRALYAIAVSTYGHVVGVAVSTGRTGVYFSAAGGVSGTFHHIGLDEENVRVLVMQSDGVGLRAWLWAGIWIHGLEEGKGCYRCELQLGGVAPDSGTAPVGNWEHYEKKWLGGSCLALGFDDQTVVAATHSAGVIRLDFGTTTQEWRRCQLDCGLPLLGDEAKLFQPVRTVGVGTGWVLAGGPYGIFRSGDHGLHYQKCSNPEYVEKVPVPPGWLLCSGNHVVTVVEEA